MFNTLLQLLLLTYMSYSLASGDEAPRPHWDSMPGPHWVLQSPRLPVLSPPKQIYGYNVIYLLIFSFYDLGIWLTARYLFHLLIIYFIY